MKLAYRLLIFALAVVALFTTVGVMLVDQKVRNRIVVERANALARDAGLIGIQWQNGGTPQTIARQAAIALGARVTLIDPTGTIIGDAATGTLEARQIGEKAMRPEVRQANAGEVGVTIEQPADPASGELYVAVPVERGVVRVAVDMASLNEIFAVAYRDMISAG